ncbi:hypothetical protein CLM62_17975 [Streptomyces sp. SA15]|nr:hypothetical protein CLM62_17975 [Streptomyces sp. SA15]
MPPSPLPPRRRKARTTRTRILEAARRELGRSPDSSLADIAEAAGVARRTVYGHFAGRAALGEGLGVLTRRVVHAADGWLTAECGVAAVVVVGEPSKHTCWRSWTASTPASGPTTGRPPRPRPSSPRASTAASRPPRSAGCTAGRGV